ncbi:lipoprotein insertase outer membrane protein LolB, partial [Pseudomonas aeruginosa]
MSPEVAGQGRYQAESPAAQLEEQLGLRLPVSHLLSWARSLPAPDNKSRLTL